VLVAAFFAAYLSEGKPLPLHVWAGYAVGAVVLLRVIWGFVGPQHARFADFVPGPTTVLGYLRELLRFRPRRYIGHSPAGGVMIVALLLCLAVTVGAGLLAYGAEKDAGPLAFLFPAPSTAGASEPTAGAALFPTLDEEAEAPASDREDGATGPRREESVFVEVHELFANLTLALVILHVGGVVVASLVHRENLARAMVTGRKRAP
jgi:cytochrome b